MIIDCISDLHGFYPKLDGGDLLIVAGDLTSADNQAEHREFFEWLDSQNYCGKLYIAGNHDSYYKINKAKKFVFPRGCYYLEDQGAFFGDLKIWGSPWTPWFADVNPRCMAYMKPDSQLKRYWNKIPEDVDILITHGPMHGIRDKVNKWNPKGDANHHAGSKSLLTRVMQLKKLKYHIFGHIHESYGSFTDLRIMHINCSHVDENYTPVNKPIRIEI